MLSNMVDTSHAWLLSTWHVPSETEKVMFWFQKIKFKSPLVAASYCIGQCQYRTFHYQKFLLDSAAIKSRGIWCIGARVRVKFLCMHIFLRLIWTSGSCIYIYYFFNILIKVLSLVLKQALCIGEKPPWYFTWKHISLKKQF